MANEKDAIEQGLNAAKASAENDAEKQQVEQLSSILENSVSSVNNDETDDEPRVFPGVL